MSVPFQCRSCSSNENSLLLDLGVQPLAGNFLRPEDLHNDQRFPLRLALCRACWLMQIVELVPPVQLFSEYLYFSSFSETMLRHAREAAERYISEFALSPRSQVIEIASNDGYMLQNFVRHGIPCLGIEPAANVAKVAREKSIETIIDFFGSALGQKLADGCRQADLVLANNVFAHAPETNDFVAGIAALLKPDGRAVLEFPYGVDLIEHVEFDTIFHEHVFYFTLIALRPLFERHGLEIYRVERHPLHGGSLRLFSANAGAYPVEPSVSELLLFEQRRGLGSLQYYKHFAQQALDVKHSLFALVTDLCGKGHRVAAYGASAKGSTLLNFVGLNRSHIEFVADRNIHKQGRLTPGTHIPIVSAEQLAVRQPDFTLLLTWNFATEILAQQQAYRERGGKFIIPIPKVSIV